MGWWKRAKDWLPGAAGRVRALFDELPEARELLAELNAESVVAAGDALERLEPEDSLLFRGVVKVANLLDFIAPVAGIGSDKERALIAKVRQVAKLVNVADERFDALWTERLRPKLVEYIATKKGAK
jgi:hypothetical protein